ncbi:MAG: FHA domain-containing protein [Pseudomonadota bacterium]
MFRYTGGVPRLINTLCDTAMMSAFAIDKDTVDVAEVQAAIDELQWVEYSSRTNRMSRVDLHVPVLRPVSPETVLGRLQVTTEGRTVAECELRPGRFIVGRTPDNDLQLDSKYISRHHCQLTVTADGVLVEDLNSTNGMYLEGRRVRRHLLHDGDVVVVGKHELRYSDEGVVRTRGFEIATGALDTSSTGRHESLQVPALQAVSGP